MRVLVLEVLLLTLLSLSVSWAGDPIVVGGFDATRSGATALITGSTVDELRIAILAVSPDVSLVETGTITPEFLEDIDLLLIHVAISNSSLITPLDTDEQSAMLAFVEGGGEALLFAEAGGTADPVNASVAGPFGLTLASSFFSGTQTATVSAPPSHPLTDGPFGAVTVLSHFWPGWITSLGPATTLATLDANGEPSLITVPPGALSPGSGTVLLVTDDNGFWDGFLDTDETALVQNMIALAAPPHIRGDANQDLSVNVADAITTLDYLFLDGAVPCLSALDFDDNGSVTISDAFATICFLFCAPNGAGPPAPFPACGTDPTLDELGCTGQSGCP